MERRKVKERGYKYIKNRRSRLHRSSSTGIIRLGTGDNRKEADKSPAFPGTDTFTDISFISQTIVWRFTVLFCAKRFHIL